MTRTIFTAVGAPRHVVDPVAQFLVNANLTGHDSHGVLRIPSYLQGIPEGRLVPSAEPEAVKETSNTLVLSGKRGFGHYTAWKAMERAIEGARKRQIYGVSLVDTNHIGRLGEWADMAAKAGFIGTVTYGSGGKNSGRTVPFGGAEAAMSTNPLAVGIPTGDEEPFVLDFATSVVAEGKLRVARSKNADVPEGLIVDKDGNPTTRTEDFYNGGYLLPFGAHKGSALSLMVAMMGGLSGCFDLETGTMRGVFMQVINIEAFTSAQAYQKAARAFLNGIRNTPPAPGFGSVLAPGDFERQTRARRLEEGVEIPDTIFESLQEEADKLNVFLDESIVEPADVERYR